MSKSGKGRVSNELVVASCAAVLAVYGAGYWRTRDVARRMESQAQERRPMQRPPAPIALVEPVAPPEPIAPAVTEPPAPPPVVDEPVAAAPVEKPPPPPIDKPKPKPPPKPQPAPAAPVVLSVPLPTVPDLATSQAAGAQRSPSRPLRDGTYTGWGQSYHGDIEAKLVVENGRIVASGIVSCATRYPCDVIESIIFQPVERQDIEVDRVTRATESADAYYYGLQEALKQAFEATDAPAAASP